MKKEMISAQKEICIKYDAEFLPPQDDMKVGIAPNVRQNLRPINGIRHPIEGDTSGWYIWAGEELSQDPEFFKPLHIKHIPDWCPMSMKFLGLPPGWRFLISDNYEDVWFDESLLQT
jgi:hypothetical protein